MTDLIEDTLAPEVVVRRGATTEVDIRPAEGGGPPLVGVSQGALWARAEAGSTGVELGHGTLNIVVRSGTVLLDAHGGAGLVIVLRGEVEILCSGAPERVAGAGDALTFDATGRVSDPDPVDAAELAHDPFVSLNLVLDSLGGVPVQLDAPAPPPVAGSAPASPSAPAPDGDDDDRKRGKGLFARAKR